MAISFVVCVGAVTVWDGVETKWKVLTLQKASLIESSFE
jgi:hypothetical protein